jgi:hypothetical protein
VCDCFFYSCIPYEGELLPEELFEKFASEFHCPTAVQAAHLDYTDDSGTLIKVILLGNPTCIGPNMNASDQTTAALQVSKKYANIAFSGNGKSSKEAARVGDKLQVKDDCVHFTITSAMLMQARQYKSEFVTKYETDVDRNKFFKAYNEESVFCDVCFSLTQSKSNPILCCDAQLCLNGRHRECFDTPPSKEDLPVFAHTCQDHSGRRRNPRTVIERSYTPNSNLPPAFQDNSRAKRYDQVMHESDTVGLQFNCSALNVEVRESSLKAAGRGLFALKKFKVGEVIGYFFGRIVSEREYAAKFCEKSELPSNKFEEVFMREAEQGVLRCLDVSTTLSDEADAYRLLISAQCPVGYINDPVSRVKSGTKKNKRSHKVNCEVQLPSTGDVEADGQVSWKLFPLAASSKIDQGEEFFFSYNWDDIVWGKVLKAMSSPLIPILSSSSIDSPPATSSRQTYFTPSPPAPTPRAERRRRWDLFDPMRYVHASENGMKDDEAPPIFIRQLNSGYPLFPMDEKPEQESAAAAAALPVINEDGELVLVDDFNDSDNEEEVSHEKLEAFSYEMASVARGLEDKNQLVPDSDSSAASDSDSESDSVYGQSIVAQDTDDDNDDMGDDGDENYEQASSSDEDEEVEVVGGPGASPQATCSNKPDPKNPETTKDAQPDAQSTFPSTKVKRLHATKYKFRIRTPKEAQALPHFKKQAWSQHEMKGFRDITTQYIKREKEKFSKVAAQDLLDEKSRNRVIKFNHLQVDWGEISACCGRQEGVPSEHPLRDVTALLRRRVDILGQVKSGDEGAHQCILDYIHALSPDPADPSMKEKETKLVLLYGQRCCLSCFRAFVGVNRSTMFNVRATLLDGEFVAADLRKKKHKLVESRVSKKLLDVITTLDRMKDFADSLPTTEGGDTRESFAFPYSRKTDLYNAVKRELNPTGAEELNISESTMREAIQYLYHFCNMTISVRKKKRFMQCAQCFQLDNRKQAAGEGKSKDDFRKSKGVHLLQVNAQRQDYHNLRDMAM